MNQNILNQYQINFVNKINDFEIGGKEITKIPNTNNQYLFEFLFNWSVEEMDEYLLPYLDQVLNSTLSEY